MTDKTKKSVKREVRAISARDLLTVSGGARRRPHLPKILTGEFLPPSLPKILTGEFLPPATKK